MKAVPVWNLPLRSSIRESRGAVADDLAIFKQRFGEKSRSARSLLCDDARRRSVGFRVPRGSGMSKVIDVFSSDKQLLHQLTDPHHPHDASICFESYIDVDSSFARIATFSLVFNATPCRGKLSACSLLQILLWRARGRRAAPEAFADPIRSAARRRSRRHRRGLPR